LGYKPKLDLHPHELKENISTFHGIALKIASGQKLHLHEPDIRPAKPALKTCCNASFTAARQMALIKICAAIGGADSNIEHELKLVPTKSNRGADVAL